jgi:hypothetical protein
MEREAKRQSKFIKNNKSFFCRHRGIVATPEKCARSRKYCLQAQSECDECTICRSAYNILLPDKEKKPAPSFMDEVRKIAQEELGKDQEMDRDTQTTTQHEQKEVDSSSLTAFNPCRVNHCWRPAEPCVSLTEKNLYINTEAVREFDLHDYKRVTLLYDHLNNIIVLDFTDNHPRHMQLTVTHRNSGDAKLSFIGFRKNFEFAKDGKFRAMFHDQGRILVDLDQKVGS